MTAPLSLEEALARWDRAAARPAVEEAERQRQELQRDFPLEGWPTMPLERYALGGDNPQQTLCWRLEFGTLALGSIRGGSSRKLMLYKHRDKPGWYFDARYGDEHEAWEAIRAGFVEAFRLAAEGDFEAIDELTALRGGPALRLKATYAYFPEGLLPTCSKTHLDHFLRVLGEEPSSWAAVATNRALLQAVQRRPEFEGWSTKEVERFFYAWSEPRPTTRVVKIAPGPGADRWPDCEQGGYICVGWDEVGDLSQFASREDFDERFAAEFPYNGSRGQVTRKANELWTLMELEAGDIVIANRGVAEVCAIGKVTDGGYRWMPERPDYRHTVGVEWNSKLSGRIEPVKAWATVTVKHVPAELHRRILSALSGTGNGSENGGPEPVVPQDPLLLRLEEALARKGQAVLYGPPGTGKTYTARRFATWWLAGGSGDPAAAVLLADPRAFAEREEDLRSAETGRLTTVTFHPSYTYEDFVEGYKPTGEPGGLRLELRDGVFKRLCRAATADPNGHYLLVVDEINRGNIPKIFGELITLLELDKRGLVVRLPQSGDEFSVPPNLFMVGTMNTADRSIHLLDAALRRRFAFLELLPDPEVLSGATVGPLALDVFLMELNRRIILKLGREKQVGHSLLLDGGRPARALETPEAFSLAFRLELLPLLQEYAYEDYSELQFFLGPDVIDVDAQMPRPEIVDDPDALVQALAQEFGAQPVL